GEAVRKIFLIGIASEILKRQYGEHDFLRYWRSSSPKVPPGHIARAHQNDRKCKHNCGRPPPRPTRSRSAFAHWSGGVLTLCSVSLQNCVGWGFRGLDRGRKAIATPCQGLDIPRVVGGVSQGAA